MSKAVKDIITAVVCIVFALVFIFLIIPHQIPLPKYASGGITPRIIPQVSCVLIITMSVIILIRYVMREKGFYEKLIQEFRSAIRNGDGLRAFGNVLLVFALSVLYYLGYDKVGFFITTIVLFPVYAFALGCRKPVSIIITDIILTFGVYYSFVNFMGCYLPGWAPF